MKLLKRNRNKDTFRCLGRDWISGRKCLGELDRNRPKETWDISQIQSEQGEIKTVLVLDFIYFFERLA